jgi:predicted small lipoprotein YifL
MVVLQCGVGKGRIVCCAAGAAQAGAAKLAALLYNLALFNHAEGAAMRMPEFVTIAVILLITIMMQGCGRKGPLFLEPAPAPVVAAPAQPAATPAAPAASSVPAAPTQTQPAR